MDALLGEYDAVMKIDQVNWIKLDEANKENLFPFIQLRNLIDERKKKKTAENNAYMAIVLSP